MLVRYCCGSGQHQRATGSEANARTMVPTTGISSVGVVVLTDGICIGLLSAKCGHRPCYVVYDLALCTVRRDFAMYVAHSRFIWHNLTSVGRAAAAARTRSAGLATSYLADCGRIWRSDCQS